MNQSGSYSFVKESSGYHKSGRTVVMLDRWSTVILYMRVHGFMVKQHLERGAVWLQADGSMGVSAERKVNRKECQTLYINGLIEECEKRDVPHVSSFRLTARGEEEADRLLMEDGEEARVFFADSVDCADTGSLKLVIPATEKYHARVPVEDHTTPVPLRNVTRDNVASGLGDGIVCRLEGSPDGTYTLTASCSSVESATLAAKALKLGKFKNLVDEKPKKAVADKATCAHCHKEFKPRAGGKPTILHAVCPSKACKADHVKELAKIKKAAYESALKSFS